MLYTQAVDPFPGAVRLGGVMDHLDAIRRCRRVLFVGCGTSYHACMACRQTIEQLTNMPVSAVMCSDHPAAPTGYSFTHWQKFCMLSYHL